MRLYKIVLVAVFTVAVSFSNSAFALNLSVIGPCDQRSQLTAYVDLELKQEVTLGDLTVKVLNANRIPFKGDVDGIAQIFDSPMGIDAKEILNSTQMRAYGWCVHVDNEEPADMPDKVVITDRVKNIIWFYAYSLYSNGTWMDYCTPSWKVHSIKYCKILKSTK